MRIATPGVHGARQTTSCRPGLAGRQTAGCSAPRI